MELYKYLVSGYLGATNLKQRLLKPQMVNVGIEQKKLCNAW